MHLPFPEELLLRRWFINNYKDYCKGEKLPACGGLLIACTQLLVNIIQLGWDLNGNAGKDFSVTTTTNNTNLESAAYRPGSGVIRYFTDQFIKEQSYN